MLRLIILSIFMLLPLSVSAQWQKINDVDYVWGPFKIYTLSLFSESGTYQQGERPLMLSLKYAKPVEGRDFAISLARSWSNLGITLPDQDNVVDRLRKIMPNIRQDDVLSYIALEERGYFILNDTIISAEFNQDFNNAVVAVWLDPRVEIGRKLLNQDKVAYHANKSEVVAATQTTESPIQTAVNSAATETNVDLNVDGSKQAEKLPSQEAQKKSVDKSETNNESPKVSVQSVEYSDPEMEVQPPYDAFIIEPDYIA